MIEVTKQLAYDCCKIQQKVGLLNAKVPVLVGKTSSGKTYWVQNELSKQLKLPVVKILLQNEQPDEVLGYPKYKEKTDTLEYLKPAWWTDEPSIFFFDELDKAREDLHSSILTLMREGTVRGKSLPKGSVIVCAMNESNYLSEPLKARSLFLSFTYQTRETALENVAKYLTEVWDNNPEMPEPIECMENVHFLELFGRVHPTIYSEFQSLQLLCKGLFPPKQIPTILDLIAGKREIDYKALIDDSDMFDNFIHTVHSPSDVAQHFMEFVKVGQGKYQARRLSKMIYKFSSTNTEDMTLCFNNLHDLWFDNYPNLARHDFDTEFIRELAVKIHSLLSTYTDSLDWKIKDFDEDNDEE